jgi:hypothetical protein
MWLFGCTPFGSSRLQMFTSISSGNAASSKVNCVPQRGQNFRLPFAVESNSVGVPPRNRNRDRGTLNQATNGAPVVRRQIEQWQFVSWNGTPAASYLTSPQ